MKLTTVVFARLESKGMPDSTKDFSGPLKDVAVEMLKWLSETTMGSHISITICRNEEDLNQKTGRVGVKTKRESQLDEALAELAALGFDSQTQEN